MTRLLHFRILNVFTLGDDALTGNPLCVFEDARGLSDQTMQALALQFNLSETTFVLPPTAGAKVAARVRIFTPSFEMPFAGHPTLGTAHVVRDLTSCGDRVVLEMQAGLVEVLANGDDWKLRTARPPETRSVAASAAELAATLGLEESSVGTPLWVDTGVEQLVIPLASPADVARATPDARLLARHCHCERRNATMAYVWSRESAQTIRARFFFLSHGGLVEDPATGSACANLGAFLLARSEPKPFRVHISQGDAVGRPSRLELSVDEDGHVFVGGRVIELGRGSISGV